MHNSMIAGLSKSQMYEQRDQLVEQITAILQSKATLAEMQDKCRCIKYDGESLAPKFIDLFWIYCKIPTQIFMRLFFFYWKIWTKNGSWLTSSWMKSTKNQMKTMQPSTENGWSGKMRRRANIQNLRDCFSTENFRLPFKGLLFLFLKLLVKLADSILSFMYTLTLSWTAYYINNTNCLKHNIDDSEVNISIALFAYILLILFY